MRVILHPFIFLFFVTSLFAQKATQKNPFFDSKSIKDIKITFPNTDWDRILDSAKRIESDFRLMAQLRIDGQRFDSVAVRYKGNSSYFGVRNLGSSKLPFNIKVNSATISTLKLTNVFRDPTFIREPLSYEIAADYMPSPEANFAKIEVNGKKMGLYGNIEPIDEPFLEKHWGKDNQLWSVKCDPESTYQPQNGCPLGDKAALIYLGEDSTCYKGLYELDGKNATWKPFIQFIKLLNQQPDQLESVLNVDQCLWMLALDNVMVNLDSYIGRLSHNYYLVHGTDGRFTPVIWDLNLSFGGFAFDGISPVSLTTEQLQTLSPLLHIDNPKRPLVGALLKNPTYRKVYIAHIRTILKDWFLNKKYEQRAKEMLQVIENEVKADDNKLYSWEAYKDNFDKTIDLNKQPLIGITALMNKRIDYLKNHPLLQRVPPIIQTPIIKTEGDKLAIIVKTEKTQKAWALVRNNEREPFRYFTLLDDGKHLDGQANDGTMGIVITKRQGLQYYIIAENEEAASTLPEKSGKTFFTFE